jgi:hypothetical protein
MEKHTLETNYPCFLSVTSAQGFFKRGTKGVSKKIYQMIKINFQQGSYSGGIIQTQLSAF